jgi:hypothetical protein
VYKLKRFWESIKNHFNAFRTDKFSIKNKGSWANYIFILIGIIGAVLLLFSNFLSTDKIQNKHSDTGKYYKFDNSSKVKVDKWLWNKNQNTLDVVLEYKDIDNSGIKEDKNLSYIARANDNAKKKLKIKTLAKTNNRVALRINDVKKGFEVLGLEIYTKLDDSEKQKETSLLANEKKVKTTTKNNPKNEQDYILEFIKSDQKNVENNINISQKKVKNWEEKIDEKEAEINKLDDEKEYQTKTDKSNTDSKISGIKDDIRDLKLDIDRKKEEIKEDKEAEKLLRSKYKDTKEFNE